MNPIRTFKYACTTCDELYHHRLEAEECCPHEAVQLTCWECAECNKLHKSEDVTHLCCYDGEQPLMAAPAQLEAASQQRLSL